KGRVWSWVLFHRPYFRSFDPDVPFNTAYIELDEGPKIMSNIVDCPDGEITCDMPVRVVFDDVTDEITLPRFTPA
ncbi:MAG: OB-fold domain-containing protein, partial [Chloroflexi bacterium]|nr:OB-fold domain-containing protein [Chloroflexota bacterium]